MSLITEHLNGGIVTVRDAIELAPGELQQGDECVYRLHDAAIYGRPGRSQYNTTTIKDSTGAACAVKGLAWLPFLTNGRTNQLLALGGDDNSHGTLWAGNFTSIGGGASFTKLTGPGQVTDAAINNSTTIGSASGGFVNMVEGARITGTGIPANSVVVTVSSSTSIIISNATTGGAQTVTATFDIGIAASPSDLGTEALSTVQWGTSYYVTGIGNLYRILYKQRSSSTATLPELLVARVAGLDPVIVQPTVTRVAGSWPSVLGNGYYWFLITEIYNPDQEDEVEGTYTPRDVGGKKLSPVVGQITDYGTQTFTITFPNPVNTGVNGRLASHWAIYMSPKQDDGTTVPSLSIFRRIATTPIQSTSLTLTDTSAVTNPSQTGYAGATAAFGSRTQFTLPSAMTGAPNSLCATGASGTGAQPANKLQNFGLSTGAPFSTGTVTGVQVIGYAGGGSGALSLTGYTITLMTSTKKSYPATQAVIGGSILPRSLGGQFDTWGVAWVPADFANGTFEVVIEKNPGSQLNVDAIQVVVFYSGGSINLNGKPFRVVTYRDQIGFTIDEPANMPPPPSSTVELYQGSIVSNDLSNPSSIRWSLPGSPEAWPFPYRLTFTRDAVTCLRQINQVLLVGMTNSIDRVNTLPSEVDTDFREGIVHEPLIVDHGIVGPLAATKYTRPGSGTLLAYVSYNNVHNTDGVTSTYLNRDIKITSYIDPAYIQNCVFRNYPKEQWLVLFYTPVGGTRNTKALIFSYDQPKEDGTLRAIGPITVSARSACEATLSGTSLLLTGHQFGGLAWVEDQGSSLTGYTIDGSTQVVAAPAIISRRFYGAGIDRNTRTEKQYLQTDALGATTSMTTVIMTGTSTALTRAAGWSGVTKGMRIVHTNMPGDSVVVSVSGTTLVASQAAFETITDTVLFDTGTLSITVRAQSIGTAISNVGTTYGSTLVGGLLSTQQDAHAQAFDMKIEKVRMPDDTLFDLNTAMRIHHLTWEMDDAGKEQSRSGTL